MNELKLLENNLLNNPNKLAGMNNLLMKHQFSEEFLIKTRIYYDSWKCIRRQDNLSPYFCFRYLYDTPDFDSADNWTDYNEIYEYLKKRNYNDNDIEIAYEKAMNDRNISS